MIVRAVFDCMVFLQAAANSGGPAGACLDLVRNRRVELCWSPEILAEVRDVLTRPRTRKKFPSLTPERAEIFLVDLESQAVLGADVADPPHVVRDRKDQKYLNLAVSSSARYLVSRDHDLLDLMQDEGFRQHFPILTILDPAALLRDLAGMPTSEANPPPRGATAST